MKGRMMSCSLLITWFCCSEWMMCFAVVSSSTSSKSNHDLKESKSSKISGRIKFRRDHNSLRLFCRGVPVINRRLVVSNRFSSRMSLHSKFFSRWASSTIKYFHFTEERNLTSLMAMSYDVMSTPACSFAPFLSFLVLRTFLAKSSRIVWRSSLVPWYSTDGMNGHHLASSFCQLASVDRGATMRNGPNSFFSHRWARKPMVIIVLPRPISSARMPLIPFLNNEINQLTPTS
mmetsp:Transcript_56160/g.93277  ORF Transcript_56160/g.93277 Transcript_56160/m.93277 type:complete len:232 (+) Transcript_56160:2688-3383(+)